jgi:hypothetical protein
MGTEMKTMLIITGPQGSGNHLFSKIFALHPDVYGWDKLLDTYWIAHKDEPFAEYWTNPESLKSFDWSQSDYYVSSISCPYQNVDVPTIPNYSAFISALQELNITVKVAVIGRDQTILKSQQQRIRNRVSLPDFLENLDYLNSFDPVYLSQELLYLYKGHYIKNIAGLLDFPVDSSNPTVEQILETDANSKYIRDIEIQELDKYVRKVSFIK